MYVHRILLSICRLFLDLFVIFKLFLSEIKERINKKKQKQNQLNLYTKISSLCNILALLYTLEQL